MIFIFIKRILLKISLFYNVHILDVNRLKQYVKHNSTNKIIGLNFLSAYLHRQQLAPPLFNGFIPTIRETRPEPMAEPKPVPPPPHPNLKIR